ncbi:prolyl oligopeptidase family serine peptidase [Natranaerobius thermophilus]|uniref:prolyl oligopeptidase n=1 Tax=Natranaerobius thermophilus (strain ATCC BAA-1301 / DSM 18059 / JW/NM-WN-LF) TaxID=457570 RepID=B2A6K4_NATTJ|nr:prolyl oligopeptidase family serine peptidase [Natranaerobius thermophilus]ACB85537.1 Prolyl oligopeptidase [Natranaerobius thermophilus JW/NM-WN-LF]
MSSKNSRIVVEDFHGTKVYDPYRWLEDEKAPEVKEWREREQEQTKNFLEGDLKTKVKQRLEKLYSFPQLYIPVKKGQRYFYQYHDGLQNQPVLYFREANEDKEKLLVDPNKFSDDGTTAITVFFPSDDGKLLAYSLSRKGSDWQEIYIINVETGEKYPETIQYCRFTNVAWSKDNLGFYYSRFPNPEGVAEEDQNKYNKVYYHKIGRDQSNDELIYEDNHDKELVFNPFLTHDGEYICLFVRKGTDPRNGFYIKKADSEDNFTKLFPQGEAMYKPMGIIGNTFYFLSDKQAPKGKIIAVDLNNQTQKTVIAETDKIISDAAVINNHLVLVYQDHGSHLVNIFNLDGVKVDQITLADYASISGLSGQPNDPEMFIAYNTLLRPTTILRYTFDGESEIYKTPEISYELRDFESKQIFYESKDGTQVPMFLIYKKGLELNGNNPALIFGYGGFKISMNPRFSPANIKWIEEGGIFAIACIRGGNEYGEDWHRQGMLLNKQNVFDDFIAAGEWLIDNNYTRKDKLAITGRSNGGLLVAACMTQRPDLYGAVVCGVPVIDMLRFHKFTIGRYWIPEYGDPDNDPQAFENLYSYSPLHNISKGEVYPHTLVLTADTDDRVVPAHALKFVRALKDNAKNNQDIFLRMEKKAGHGLGKPIGKRIEEDADWLSFLLKVL